MKNRASGKASFLARSMELGAKGELEGVRRKAKNSRAAQSMTRRKRVASMSENAQG